jgi:hypothetical protein
MSGGHSFFSDGDGEVGQSEGPRGNGGGVIGAISNAFTSSLGLSIVFDRKVLKRGRLTFVWTSPTRSRVYGSGSASMTIKNGWVPGLQYRPLGFSIEV